MQNNRNQSNKQNSHQDTNEKSKCLDDSESNNESLIENKKDNMKKKRNPFTKEEDDLLINLVKKFGTQNRSSWRLISYGMENRNIRQCRERYNFFLNTSSRKTDKWSKEDDQLLLYQYSKIGPQWKKMEMFFEKRTLYDIKNRFNTIMHRKKNKNNLNKDSSIENENNTFSNSKLQISSVFSYSTLNNNECFFNHIERTKNSDNEEKINDDDDFDFIMNLQNQNAFLDDFEDSSFF